MHVIQAAARKRAETLESSLQESRSLIAQLEADLEHRLSATPTLHGGSGGGGRDTLKSSSSTSALGAEERGWSQSKDLKLRVGSATGGPGAPDAALLQLLAMEDPTTSSGSSTRDASSSAMRPPTRDGGNGGGHSLAGAGRSMGSKAGGGRDATATSSGQAQMISILQAQRDRYKERLDNVSGLSVDCFQQMDCST